MTDLVNPFDENDPSSQPSEPNTDTLRKEKQKGRRAQSLPNVPIISPRNMLKKLEKAEKIIQSESLTEGTENVFQKTEEEGKSTNLYLVSHEFVDSVSKASSSKETENADDSDIINPELKNLLNSPTAETSKKIKNKLKDLENVTLNIAITGMTGAGKSSFVNAMRGIRNGDSSAAPTGVTETTMQPKMYPHPTMPNVKIWDLPGIGSPKFKASKYLKDVKFNTYDFFLIVSSERFKENDIELAKAIKKNKKLFYFIRTKIDNDLRAEGQRRDFDRQTFLNTVRVDCEKNLQKVGTPKVFLISSFQLENYDFQRLVNTLEDELPENKRFALIQSMPVYSLDALTKKKTYFKKMIWLNAFAAGVGAIPPIPGMSVACDYGIMLNFFKQVFTAFGLSDDALDALSERVNNKPVELFKSVRTSRFRDGVTEAVVIEMLSKPVIVIAKVMGTVMSLLPGGALPAAGTAVATVHYLLNRGLNEMAEDKKNILIVSELAPN